MRNLYENFSDSPGVYLMRDWRGRVLYIGKAANLRRRVLSYFQKAHEYKIERLLNQIKKIDCKKTETAIEALILESKLIKKYTPIFNVKEKDDKSFLWVEITNEKYPRVLLARGKNQSYETKSHRIDFGPFTSATSIREALRIIRRIFPYSIHPQEHNAKLRMYADAANKKQIKKHVYPELHRRACFDYELGLCPGTCIGAISRSDYLKNIRNIKLFFEGKKEKIIKSLIREMNAASKKLEFEEAEKLRRQIFALQHIRDIALIRDEKLEIRNWKLGIPAKRVEGYDVSNISGSSATGAMVVFRDGKPDKNEYRKFKIRTIAQPDDVGMLKEVLRRRFNNPWPLPNLILIDGGKGQVNAANSVIEEFGLKIPVVGIGKGPKRKKNEFHGAIPKFIDGKTLIKIRNEAHRFAIKYHKELRGREFSTGSA